MIDIIRQHYFQTKNIEQAAEELLCFYSDEYDGGAVPVTAIARRLRIAVKALPIDNKLMGMLLVGDDVKKKFMAKRVVLLNERLAYEYKRVTLARELGHYIFDYNPSRMSSYSSRIYAYADDKPLTEAENRAASFATALLLSPAAVRQAYEQSEGTWQEKIRHLAAVFKIPEALAAQRIDELKLL